MIRRTIVAAAFFILTSSGFAADAYVLRFSAGSMINACTQGFWADELIFHNAGSELATVRLVDSSYPIAPLDAREFILAAGEARSFRSFGGVIDLWVRETQPGDQNDHFLGVLQLDMPEQVQVTSRTIPGIVGCTGSCLCPPFIESFGAVPHRVYNALILAGTPHVHLGSDLPGTATRTNVQIYNGGFVDAEATVEVRQSCDGRVLDGRTVTVPARSVATVGGLNSTELLPQPGGIRGVCDAENVSFVRVVATQPALSWVTTIANGVTIPRVELTSSCN